MKIKITIHIFLVSAMTSVSCQAIPKQEPNSPEPTPSKVITYKAIDNVKLKLYIFDPAEVKLKPVPVIVFFHGGAWKRGDPSQFYRHCQYLASRGIFAISAQYRLLSDKITVRDCVTDGKSAIRWLRQNAKEFNIDPNRIAAAGGSAGGHIAACTALIDKYDETSEDLKISSKPNALILFNPALDITILKITSILGEEPFNLSPAHHLDKTLPPTLIMHGTSDTAVPIESVHKFSRYAGKIGCNCRLVEFKGRQHAFFNYSKSKEDFQACLDEVEDFLVSLGYIKTRTFLDSQAHKRHCLIVVNDAENPTLAIGIDRIKSFYKVVIETSEVLPDSSEQHKYKLIIVLGTADSRQELKRAWQKFDGDDGDCFMVKTIKQDPPTIAVTGIGLRGTLYAAYRMAELLETGTELSSINVRLIPKVKSRYAYVAGATHAGRIHRPDLFIKTLQELPRYGFNGILMCPGATAATPIGYHSGLPFSYPANLGITKDGRLDPQPEELQQWKTLLKKYDDYGLETMIYWYCLVPPGYDQKSVLNYYYHGGPEPPDYLEALRQYNYNLARTFIETFPEIDIILFGPVEGGEWGQTVRLFTGNHHVSEKHVLPAYLDSLSKVCKQYNKRLAFWTHVAGITSSGIRALREALYKYPEILIVEDDYWPNAGWAHMKVFGYLPDDLLMALADRKNSLGMFQSTTDGEYYGGGSMPNAFPEPFADSARQAVRLNAELVIMRLDLHDRTEFGTLFNMAEINPLSASAQLWSPTPSQDELWKSWARRRFGPKAAELILPALRSSGEIIQTGFVYSGLHLAEWSAILARTWYVSDSPASGYNLFGRAGTPITPKSKNDILQHADYYALQGENRTVSIAEFQARQNAAIKKAKQGIAQIDKAKAYLCQEDYDYLHDAFEKATVMLEALKLLGNAAYATHIMMDNFDNVSDPKAAFEKAIDDLKKFADEVHKKYGPDLEYPPLHTNLVNIANHYQQYIHRERKD